MLIHIFAFFVCRPLQGRLPQLPLRRILSASRPVLARLSSESSHFEAGKKSIETVDTTEGTTLTSKAPEAYLSIIKVNKEMNQLLKDSEYNKALALYSSNRANADRVTFGTMMSGFGRASSHERAKFMNDPRFKDCIKLTTIKMLEPSFFKCREVANIVLGAAKLNIDVPELYSVVLGKEALIMREGNPQEVANTVYAFGKVGHPCPSLLDAVEARADWLVKEGDPQVVANTVWAFGKLGQKCSKLLGAIESRADWLIEEGNPQAVANTVWAFGTLGQKCPKLLGAVEARVDWLVKEGVPQAVANTVWGFATLGQSCPKLLGAVQFQADWLVKVGKPQEVANTVWGFGTLGQSCPKLLEAVEARADWLVKEGKPQNVANTVWSFATLGHKCPKLLGAVEFRADWLVKEGKPQEMANTIWGFATLGQSCPKLLGAVEARADWLVTEGKPQEVANTVWGFATLGQSCPKLLGAVEARADWLVKEGKTQEVANTLWGFGKLGHACPKLLGAVEARADWFVKGGDPQAVANTIWAFGTLGNPCPKLLGAVEARADWLVNEGKPQEVANTVWAFATLDQSCPKLLGAVEARADSLVKEVNPQNIANTLWSFAVAGLVGLTPARSTALQTLWRALLRFEKSPSSEDIMQLYQFEVACRLEAPSLQLEPVNKYVRERILQAARIGKNTVSSSQRGLCYLLRDIGLTAELEVSPFEADTAGFMAIDIAIPKSKLAVEFDGPSHFLTNGDHNGATKFKTRLLIALGWRVERVSYLEWRALSSGEKHAWARKRFGVYETTATLEKRSAVSNILLSANSRLDTIIHASSGDDGEAGTALPLGLEVESKPEFGHDLEGSQAAILDIGALTVPL